LTNNIHSFIDRGMLWDVDDANQIHPFTEGSRHFGRKKDMNFSGNHGTYYGKRLSGNHLMVYLALAAIESTNRSPLHEMSVIRVHMRELIAEIGWNGGFTKNSNKTRPLLLDLHSIQYFKNIDGITSHGSDRLLPILDISEDVVTFRLGTFAQSIFMIDCIDGHYTSMNRAEARYFSGNPEAFLFLAQLSARVIQGEPECEFTLEKLIGYVFGNDFDEQSHSLRNHSVSIERYIEQLNDLIDADCHRGWHIRLLRVNKFGQKVFGVRRTVSNPKTTYQLLKGMGTMIRPSHPHNQPGFRGAL